MTTTVLKIDAAFYNQLTEAAAAVNDLKQFEGRVQKVQLYKQFETPAGIVHVLVQYEDTNQIFYLGWHYFKEIKNCP